MNAPDLTLPAPIDRTKITWSYTFLHTYDEVCPHQAWRKFIKRDISFVSTPTTEKGTYVHKAMKRRMDGKPLPDDLQEFERFAKPFDGKNVESELSLGVTTHCTPIGSFDPLTWGRGTLDVVIRNGATAYLCDWKSGKSKYETPFELEVHAVLLHAKYPDLTKIVGQYVYLGENKISQMYDLSHTAKTWSKIERIMSEVKADLKARHFEKRQGPLCGYCDVKDCQFNRKQ
jgi:hypothetical protein